MLLRYSLNFFCTVRLCFFAEIQFYWFNFKKHNWVRTTNIPSDEYLGSRSFWYAYIILCALTSKFLSHLIWPCIIESYFILFSLLFIIYFILSYFIETPSALPTVNILISSYSRLVSRNIDQDVVYGFGYKSESDWWTYFNSTVHCVQKITGLILFKMINSKWPLI